MSEKMHDWPNPGGVAACCGRPRAELPLSDGRTTDPQGVTCDGTFTPAVWAHDVYPHPSDRYDDGPPIEEAAKYHVARTLAMTSDDVSHPDFLTNTERMLAERATAWHVAALARGLSGQAALRWVHNHQADDSNEMLYDLAAELGVELNRIKPYVLREPKPADFEGRS